MRVLVFSLFLLFSSCKTTTKGKSTNACSFKVVSSSFEEKSDTTAVIKLQKLGTNYLNFVINSCSPIGNNSVKLKGYVYCFDPSVKNGISKLVGVRLIKAINYTNDELVYKSFLGETDRRGEFDIQVSIENPKMHILVSKEKYHPCSVQLFKVE